MKPALSAIAPAKINLSLHVTGITAKGYHTLNSHVAFATSGDLLHITPHDGTTDTLSITGDFAADCPTTGDNLVLRAVQLMRNMFKQAHQPPVHITLEKLLPVASGIGGGSADAACIMQLLNSYWQIGADATMLAEAGIALGADVPMCLYGAPCFVSGVGETITPLKPHDKAYPMLLMNPLKGVSTPEIFTLYDKKTSSHRNEIAAPKTMPTLATLASDYHNDLTEHAISLCPEVGDMLTLTTHHHIDFSGMSGSGATVFAVSEVEEALASLATEARARGWWVMETEIAL